MAPKHRKLTKKIDGHIFKSAGGTNSKKYADEFKGKVKKNGHNIRVMKGSDPKYEFWVHTTKRTTRPINA